MGLVFLLCGSAFYAQVFMCHYWKNILGKTSNPCCSSHYTVDGLKEAPMNIVLSSLSTSSLGGLRARIYSEIAMRCGWKCVPVSKGPRKKTNNDFFSSSQGQPAHPPHSVRRKQFQQKSFREKRQLRPATRNVAKPKPRPTRDITPLEIQVDLAQPEKQKEEAKPDAIQEMMMGEIVMGGDGGKTETEAKKEDVQLEPGQWMCECGVKNEKETDWCKDCGKVPGA